MTPSAKSTAPLNGIKILDLTRLLPGPACTLHLADLGADVIKIEDTQLGDYANWEFRALVNRNKHCMRLDLKKEAGQQVLLELVKEAHILVESFRPGVMQRLGVDYPRLREVNPALVFCSITGFGQDGPLSEHPGHDINFCALSGVADQVGHPDTGPALSNVPFGDLLGGSMMATTGILAALFDAHRTGIGRHVDISIADAMLAQNFLPLAHLKQHQSQPQVGHTTLTGGRAFYAIYSTRDGRYIGVGAFEKKFWDAFCDLVQRPDLKPHHQATDEHTIEYVKAELQSLFKSQDFGWWQEKLAHSHTCVTPILRPDEALQHPHFKARRMSLGAGDEQQLGCPIKMTNFEFSVRQTATPAGTHTRQLLASIGYDEQQIQQLFDQGAVA